MCKCPGDTEICHNKENNRTTLDEEDLNNETDDVEPNEQ